VAKRSAGARRRQRRRARGARRRLREERGARPRRPAARGGRRALPQGGAAPLPADLARVRAWRRRARRGPRGLPRAAGLQPELPREPGGPAPAAGARGDDEDAATLALVRAAGTAYRDHTPGVIPLVCDEPHTGPLEAAGARVLRRYGQSIWLEEGFVGWYRHVEAVYRRRRARR
jgi:hypothetical protein